jgi:hypothetical protein
MGQAVGCPRRAGPVGDLGEGHSVVRITTSSVVSAVASFMGDPLPDSRAFTSSLAVAVVATFRLRVPPLAWSTPITNFAHRLRRHLADDESGSPPASSTIGIRVTSTARSDRRPSEVPAAAAWSAHSEPQVLCPGRRSTCAVHRGHGVPDALKHSQALLTAPPADPPVRVPQRSRRSHKSPRTREPTVVPSPTR